MGCDALRCLQYQFRYPTLPSAHTPLTLPRLDFGERGTAELRALLRRCMHPDPLQRPSMETMRRFFQRSMGVQLGTGAFGRRPVPGDAQRPSAGPRFRWTACKPDRAQDSVDERIRALRPAHAKPASPPPVWPEPTETAW